MTMEEKRALAREILATPPMAESGITPAYCAVLERVSVQELQIPTRVGPARVLAVEAPGRRQPSPLCLNIHGGGFVRPYNEKDTVFSARIAEATGCLVLDLDYRLAPEHPFPQPQHECYDVACWAVEQAQELGIDPARIAVGGHSAGGDLAASLTLRANRTGAFRPRLCIVDYACLDLATDPAEKPRNADSMPLERMLAYDRLCVNDEIDWHNPMLSPVWASPRLVQGLPPHLLIAAGRDCLRVDTHRYHSLLQSAGVPVELHEFAHSRHGFTVNCLDEWEAAQALYLDALRRAFSKGEGVA